MRSNLKSKTLLAQALDGFLADSRQLKALFRLSIRLSFKLFLRHSLRKRSRGASLIERRLIARQNRSDCIREATA